MSAQPAGPEHAPQASPGASQLAYLPGLDGLRAVAVTAVLLYHAGVGIYGGFLGVETFFVLSGFLITSLLLADWREHGRISLKQFWLRRARRLLPALFLTLAGTLALTAILLPEELGSLARDTLAAVAYVTNWYLIASGQSYFDAVARPSLLQHLWSLAIEEQFYLLWPLVCWLCLRFARVTGFLVLTIAAAVAGAMLMGVLYDPGADPARIYYGTDTRASGLLLGAALALVRERWPARPPQRRAGAVSDAVGVVALATLLVAYLVLHEQHPLLYRGGFSVTAIATVLVIAAAIHPAARFVPWLLELPPLRWVGLRSYGIYLWYWPIFMVTRPGVDLPDDTWWLQVGRIGLIVAVAACSYSLLEQPIRHGALGQVWRAFRGAQASGPRDVPPLAEPAPHRPASMLHIQAAYRRHAPSFATGLLALSVLAVVASVTQQTARQASGAGPTLTSAVAALEAGSGGASDSSPSRASAAAEQPATGATATPAERAEPAATAADQEEAVDPELAAELQRILDATVADGSIPGAVLSVSLPNGAAWSGACGYADPQAGTAMTPETRVRIGSLSKMLTAVVVLQLVEEGAVELDAPVATWLPDLLPRGDAITVRNLLQHTSGLYDYLEDRRFVSQAYQEPERIWEPEELVAYAAQFPLSFEPGAPDSWDYSNTNFVVLGMIIEQVTGRPLHQELRERILEPFGMQQTYSVPAETVEGPQARGFSRSDDQTDVPMSFVFGTGNIVTTVDDLRRFARALFGAELLDPKTLALMEEFVNGKGQYDMPELGYGLGLMRNRLPVDPGPNDQPRPAAASRVVGHIGGFGGFRAALWYVPESDTLVVLSVNQAAVDPNILATQVLGTILTSQGR